MTVEDNTDSDRKILRINQMPFIAKPGIVYEHDYEAIMHDVFNGKLDEYETYQELCLKDLWFLVYFALRVTPGNHPFVVNCCREVQHGPASHTLDIWARDHFKSTIITKAETIQSILKNPEERICIFSYARGIAAAFLRSIKIILEESIFLQKLFPHILYENPIREAPKWSEYDGLIVKRKGFFTESTIEAAGLIEGMPTSRHYTRRVYDDIITADLVENPDVNDKVIDKFEVSQNLGTDEGIHRVIGTFYHHNDVLTYIVSKKNADGTPHYHYRKKPATIDGEPNGMPVLLSQHRLDELKLNPRTFACQQLLDPTPKAEQKLNPEYLKIIKPIDLPRRLYRMMVIDPAGFNEAKRNDCWAMLVIGVNPVQGEFGLSDVYLLDMIIEKMDSSTSQERIVHMYTTNGRILKVGVEKVGMGTMEIHVANALKEAGHMVSLENGSLEILKSAGRNKQDRIINALQKPLNAGKLHILETIPFAYRQRLIYEMQKFPYWHDDGLDAFSYFFDMIKDYRFPRYNDAIKYDEQGNVIEDHWDRAFAKAKQRNFKESWMGA